MPYLMPNVASTGEPASLDDPAIDGVAFAPKVDTLQMRKAILAKLTYAVGKDPAAAKLHDWLRATILAVRDRVVDRWIASDARDLPHRPQARLLSVARIPDRPAVRATRSCNLGSTRRDARGAGRARASTSRPSPSSSPTPRSATAASAGSPPASWRAWRRSASPRYGYGIRYDHGLFRQKIVDGWQVELPEDWLAFGNPWEFERREIAYEIGFGGTVEAAEGWDGAVRHTWKPAERVLAVAYDTPIVGWRGARVNTLRLWSARAADPIHLDAFNRGDHVGAVAERTRAESISRVLYPSDATPAGQELRLRQEFFFTSASLQDLIRRHIQQFGDIRSLPDKVAIQLNDTHPAIAVAELMRLLVDVHGARLGRSLDDHPRRPSLHQPHAAAGGARDAGRWR